jgi:hypothetical protein
MSKFRTIGRAFSAEWEAEGVVVVLAGGGSLSQSTA